jgi:hypothetical protein
MQDHHISQKSGNNTGSEGLLEEHEGKTLAPPAFKLTASAAADAPPIQRKNAGGLANPLQLLKGGEFPWQG